MGIIRVNSNYGGASCYKIIFIWYALTSLCSLGETALLCDSYGLPLGFYE